MRPRETREETGADGERAETEQRTYTEDTHLRETSHSVSAAEWLSGKCIAIGIIIL